jgi:hypothetical protein
VRVHDVECGKLLWVWRVQLQVLRSKAGLLNVGEPSARRRGGRMKGRLDHQQSDADWRTAYPFMGAVSTRHAGQRQRSQVCGSGLTPNPALLESTHRQGRRRPSSVASTAELIR